VSDVSDVSDASHITPTSIVLRCKLHCLFVVRMLEGLALFGQRQDRVVVLGLQVDHVLILLADQLYVDDR
jgi:hypothetical protein